MTMLTRGADGLLELHAAELPQKDELCGCFWATLALRLNGEEPIEQDDVALVAGSVITSHGSVHLLPLGQEGRNDYRLELPVTGDDASSGTSAHGVALAVSELTDGRLAACPVSGLDVAGVRAVLRAAAEATAPVVLIANVQTGAFDTALALLALGALKQPDRTARPIARGRAFLITSQRPDGGWPETTRPPGGQSYAQHISTTAWAALALISTAH